jgi:hypothetical protein
MREIHMSRRKAAFPLPLILAGTLLAHSQLLATAQQLWATATVARPLSTELPDSNVISPIEPGFPGVPPAVAPMSSPGQNTASKPIFSEPSDISKQTGTVPVPTSSGQTSAANSQPTADISLNDLKPSNDLRFRIGGTLRATFDNNIFIQSHNPTSDLYTVIAPSFTVGSGNFVDSLTTRHLSFLIPQSFQNADLLQPKNQPFIYLSYTPSYTVFLDHSDQDNFSHDVIGETQISLQRLTLGAFARFQTLRQPNTDVGNLVDEQLTSIHAFAYYTLSSRTQITSELFFQNHQYSEGLIGYFELWGENWLDYNFSSKTTIGPGIAAGWLVPTEGSEQYYGRFQARVTWKPTGRLSFSGKGGIEIRNIKGRAERLYPIFGLEARYAFSAKTSAALSVFQDVRTSAAVQTLNYIGRALEGRVDQKVLDRFLLSLSVGYTNTEYDDSFSNIRGGVARTDNFLYVNLGLATTLNRWSECLIGFQYRNNDSTNSRRAFSELITTLAININF